MEKVFTKLMEFPVKTSWTKSSESQAEASLRKKEKYCKRRKAVASKFLVLTTQCLYADLPTANINNIIFFLFLGLC